MRESTPIEIESRGLILRGLRYPHPSTAPPVLALHGWIDNAATFHHAVEYVPREIVAIDLPGHGQSDHRPANAEYHYVNWVADVFGILDALEWPRVALMGHSMGAGIASLFAGTAVDRVERLALIEGLGPFTTSAAEAPENLERAWRGRNLDRTPRVYPTFDAIVERKFAAGPQLGEDAVRILLSRGARHDAEGWSFSHDPRLKERSLLRFTEDQVLAFFARVDCPALLIQAENGLAYDRDLFDARAGAISDLNLVRVPGNHHMHLVDPECVAASLSDFFA